MYNEEQDNERAWYLIQSYAGMEYAAKRNLERRIVSMNMQDYIFNILIPEEKTYEKKANGELKEVIVNPHPGYLFVDMIVTDESWFIVRNTPMVTGFIGSSGKGAKPTPLQPYEVDKILGNMGISRIDVDTELTEGAKVKIVDGPFNGMFGKVDSVDLPNQKVMLFVDLFGQETSVEVELSQIEKA